MKNEKFKRDPEYRKSKLQELLGEPEKCKAFFVKFLDKGRKRKKRQNNIRISKIDTMIENASTSQQDGAGSNRESRKKVLQKVKQKLESKWVNFEKQYQADLKKINEIIKQLKQLQRAPEQDPSTSERDEPSNQQQELRQRQSHMAIGKELDALIQRYGSNDHEFDLSKLDALELYDMNNPGEHEIHDLENNLLDDLNS